MILNQLDIILLSVFGAILLHQLYYYTRYMSVMAWVKLAEKRKLKKEPPDSRQIAVRVPVPISVLICAHNEAENITQFLPKILEQDYPEFEVIVVNDRSEDDTQIILEQLRNKYPNLRLTFVPDSACLLSTKKLAITLAVRAARYEHLVLTDADCYPASKYWLREMAKGFTNKQIVLGYGAYENGKGLLNRIIRYDTLFNGLQYLGFALTSKPYMGVGRNMAYTKSLFNEKNGFEGLLSHPSGDDDLLIQKLATRKNTAVCLTADSITLSPAKTSFRDWYQQKRRHLSVSTSYKSMSKLRLVLEPLSRAGFYGMFIAVLVLGSFDAQMLALGAFALRYLVQALVINISSHHLKQGYFFIMLLLLDIFLPLNHLMLLIINMFAPRRRQW